MNLLTSSRSKDARACQRLHSIKYQLGYRPRVTPVPLRFGTLWHRSMEPWWQGTGEERLRDALAAMAGEADPFERAKAEALMLGYHERWKTEELEVLAVEVEFQTPLVNPATGHPSRTWMLAGKIDAIVRCRDGQIRIVEHKTTSEDAKPGSAYWKRLKMDGQVSVYYAGARSLGYDVAGCIYDVVSKPRLEPLKATPEANRKYTKAGELYKTQRLEDETPDAYRDRILTDIAEDPLGYYGRGPVVRLETEMTEAMADLWQTATQIREAANLGIAPRNPDACLRFNQECAFFSVCCGEESLENTSRFVQSDNIHPELSLPVLNGGATDGNASL